MYTDKQPCGTNAAYRRHLRHGETACIACKRAAARYAQDRYNAAKRHQRYAAGEPSGWQRVIAARTERFAAPEADGGPAYGHRREYLEWPP